MGYAAQNHTELGGFLNLDKYINEMFRVGILSNFTQLVAY